MYVGLWSIGPGVVLEWLPWLGVGEVGVALNWCPQLYWCSCPRVQCPWFGVTCSSPSWVSLVGVGCSCPGWVLIVRVTYPWLGILSGAWVCPAQCPQLGLSVVAAAAECPWLGVNG